MREGIDRDNWRPLVRTGDPVTSVVSAQHTASDIAAQRAEVLARIAASPTPVTYHDVVTANCAGRVTELHRAGLIECVGIRTFAPRGRLWVVTAKGRESLA